MQKTPRNQEPAYAEPYDKVVAVGYECIPYHSQRTTYDREYDTYDTYYQNSYEADYMSRGMDEQV